MYVFTQQCKNSSVLTTSCSVTGNPEIEWTYRNSTPATNMLTHKPKKVHQQGWKQVYDNILPYTNPLAPGQCCPEPNHRTLIHHKAVGCLTIMLLTFCFCSKIVRFRSLPTPPMPTCSISAALQWGKASPTSESGITICCVKWQVGVFIELDYCIICTFVYFRWWKNSQICCLSYAHSLI